MSKYVNNCDISSISFQDIIRHEGYSSYNKKNDIALLKISKKMEFTPHVRPACLETNLDDQDTNIELYVSGWGTTKANSKCASVSP